MSLALHSHESWPTASQKLLLRAAAQDGAAALDAWRRWSGDHDLLKLDRASGTVLPSLYLNLVKQGIEVDDRRLGVLRNSYRRTWAENLISKHALLRISTLLEAAKIEVMVPKGLPLTFFYYPSLGARRMTDIDLLIHLEDLAAAAEALRAHDWAPRSALLPTDLAPFVHAEHFYHASLGCLDLHWVPFRVDTPIQATAAFWARATDRDVEGHRIRIPDATDLLLQVCFQCRKLDSQTKCRWVIDALTLINAPGDPVDWTALVARSEEADVALPVRDALSYLDNEFGPILPEETLDRLRRVADTRRARASYFEQMRESKVDRGMMELILSQWRRYLSVRRSRGESVNVFGFARYYFKFLRWRWQMASLMHLPATAAARFLMRLRSSGADR